MKPPIELYLVTAAILNIKGRLAYTEQDQLILQLTNLKPENPNFVERFLAIRPFKTIVAVPKTSTPSPMLTFENFIIKWEKSMANYTNRSTPSLDQLLSEAQLNNLMQRDKDPSQSLYNWFLTAYRGKAPKFIN